MHSELSFSNRGEGYTAGARRRTGESACIVVSKMLGRIDRRAVAVLAALIGAFALAPQSQAAVTIGNSLVSPPNGNVCKFEAPELVQDRLCTIGQMDNHPAKHALPTGLVAPFPGVIVSWSVASGPASPSTASVGLALRLIDGPGYLSKGPRVELPLSSGPGTTIHTFPERMSIDPGQPVGVATFVSNDGPLEAGAPLAFREPGVGQLINWLGEPLDSVFETETDAELLLSAVIEPDNDRDGFGDETQDPCPIDHQNNCTRVESRPPQTTISLSKRQGFLRSGKLVAWITSDEPATVMVRGQLRIGTRPKLRRFGLVGPDQTVASGEPTAVRLLVPPDLRRAAKESAKEGRRIVAVLTLQAVDEAGNRSREHRAVVKPARRG